MASAPPLSVLACIISCLYRLAAWILLRWLPIRWLPLVIPGLFAFYASSWVIGELTKEGDTKIEPVTVAAMEVVQTEVVVEVTEKDDTSKDENDGEVVEHANGDSGAEPKEEKLVEVVREDIIVEVQPSPGYPLPFITLAFTLPSSSFLLRLLSLILNFIILIFSMDFLYSPFLMPFHDVTYSRVGAVTYNSAKVVLRYPLAVAPTNSDETSVLVDDREEIRIWWRAKEDWSDDPATSWTEGPKVELLEANDWVGVVKLEGLFPSTEYEYRFAFTNSTMLPYPSEPLSFRTFPDSRLGGGANFKFIASSCIIPNFPYVPTFDSTPRIKGFDLLADYLINDSPSGIPPPSSPVLNEPADVPSVPEAPSSPLDAEDSLLDTESSEAASTETPNETPKPAEASRVSMFPPLSLFYKRGPPPPKLPPSYANTEFMLMLGDFIYADVPMYVGDDAEGYRRLYRRNYASHSYKKVYEKLPTLHIYDDHEISNNYVGNSNDSQSPFPSASNAYNIYQNNANHDPVRAGQNYYTFEYADSAFFVLDCRRYRTAPEQESGDKATMLGEQQLADFNEWILKVNNTATFKFVVSSVPFTALWGGIDGQTDTWAGYWTERHNLLQTLASVLNVFIISGDRHEFAAVFSQVPPPGGNVLEFSTSPLSQFYLPYFHTLNAKRSTRWPNVTETIVPGPDGENVTVHTTEMVPEERVLQYIPDGNHKWSTFEVDTRNPAKPKLILDLWIDGHRAWRLNVLGKEVHRTPLTLTTAIGSPLSLGFKGVMQAIGLQKILGL